jgi:hypothetical protein
VVVSPGVARQADLVRALQQPGVLEPGAAAVRLIETHLSYVLLTGRYAYKLKKAVDLGFADFESLEARRQDCEREVRLNSRLAGNLYLGVVSITGTIDDPAVDGSGPPLDFAVKMREFPQEALFSRRLADRRLTEEEIDALADEVAEFHARAHVVSSRDFFGAPPALLGLATDNFTAIRPLLESAADLNELDEVAGWTAREFRARAETMRRRRRAGFVRDCHGDLHLNNVALVDGRVVVFDCLEFSDAMRCLDVLAEVAFTMMDLADRGRADWGWRFLNRYLERTGDYDGISVLPFYLVYRSMVRAKVALLRRAQTDAPEARARLLEEYRGYCELARRFTRRLRPTLTIMHGFSGAGKTVVSGRLAERAGAVRLRSDIERKRAFGRHPLSHERVDVGAGLYSGEATRQTYRRLHELARTVLLTGYPVIVDAAFLSRWQRDLLKALAREHGVPFHIVSVSADERTLRQRVVQRQEDGRDASDAGTAVLAHQLQVADRLGADELQAVVAVNGRERTDVVLGRLQMASWPSPAVA